MDPVVCKQINAENCSQRNVVMDAPAWLWGEKGKKKEYYSDSSDESDDSDYDE